jgi:hypothetical protein
MASSYFILQFYEFFSVLNDTKHFLEVYVTSKELVWFTRAGIRRFQDTLILIESYILLQFSRLNPKFSIFSRNYIVFHKEPFCLLLE